MTPAREEEFLANLDMSIRSSSTGQLQIDNGNGTKSDKTSDPKSHEWLSKQDLALKNPVSVYNWLRKHQPQVFLQDNESLEKSSGKLGSLRGAGKRSSNAPLHSI